MKGLQLVFVVMILNLADANQFHEGLSEEHLSHYFGTKAEHEVPDYEITGPPEVTSQSTSSPWHQYTIKAFNHSYHIILQRNEHLIAPGCVVLAKQANGTSEISSCHQGEHHCYYHGHVENETDSSVAVSTCLGMHGLIRLPDHDLVIQPVRQVHVSRVRRSGHAGLPHLVYRRRGQSSSGTCGTQETPFEPVNARRAKRTAEGPHYMELRIVLAPDATKYHGSDAKRYALTSLNVAAQRFLDPTLGHDIRTAVVQILLLQNDQPGLSIIADSEQLLNSFCFWHEKRQPSSEDDAQFADGALLITKLDLEYKGDSSNLGLGHIGGFCKVNYRCSVNEDNGLDLGLTIAHETGHMLNMVHDGESNACIPGINIMSAKGASGHSSIKWSTCSKDSLTSFLKPMCYGRVTIFRFIDDTRHVNLDQSTSPVSSCLSDQPPAWAFSLLNTAQKPGLVYSGDEQCRMAMEDPNSKLCEGTSLTTGNECKMLVCYGPIIPNRQRSCYRGGPIRLDGTECGHRKWCIGGQCVAMGSGAPAPVHGGWSSWSAEWTPCSRTCGGGVRVKNRKCTSPEPRFGGRNCAGESTQAKLCNMKSCPINTDFRAEQCAATNRFPVDGKTYHWLPYNDNRCSMRCYDQYANIVDYRADKYEDGTGCKVTGPFSRCVEGQCKKFGCDGHLNSARVFDKCGVCGGQSNTCTTHHGTYNQGQVKAYVTVVSIPRGATGVVVTNDNTYCHMSVKVQGALLFSRGTSISLSGKYSSHGVNVEYRRSGPEKITISGPTLVELDIQVWRDYGNEYQGVKPQISYTYSTPIRTPYSGYVWRATQGTCSRTCGTGHSLVTVQCIRVSSNTHVEDFHCDIYARPQETLIDCNTKDCPPQWQSEVWSSCSKTCGGGSQSRVVHCVVIQGDSYTVTRDNHCNLAHKPATTKQCNMQLCPGIWKSGAWSTCSRTCGRGTQTRAVDCYASEQSNSVVDVKRCPGQEKPIISKHCMPKPCNTNIVGSSCRNKMDCTRYADNICEASEYRSWVSINCMEFCGICVKDPSVYLCKDILTDCETYEVGFCYKYEAWAESNCQRTCGFCGGGITAVSTTTEPCVDKIYCAVYQKDTCTNEAYRGWAEEHCRKFCGFCGTVTPLLTTPTTRPTTTEALGQTTTSCVNHLNCAIYASDICTSSRYRKWANENCKKHCGWCSTDSVTPLPTTPTTRPTTTEALGQTTTSCVNHLNCAIYASDICTSSRYRKWANENCKKHCGWCSTDSVSTTSTSPMTSVTSSCRDLLDCSAYLSDVCTSPGYSHWAHAHCPDHCGWCHHPHSALMTTPVTTTERTGHGSVVCVDAVDCVAYQSNICTASAYQGWAHINCPRHCGWCGTSDGITTSRQQATHSTSPSPSTSISVTQCRDKVDCAAYQNDICTNFRGWASTHCSKYCKLCGAGAKLHADTTTAKPNSGNSDSCSDSVDCSSYQGDICTNTDYKSWAKSNCPKFCHLCGSGESQTSSSSGSTSSGSDCVDKLDDCDSYQDDACTNSDYKDWAKQNCAKYCGMCADCTDTLSCDEYAGDICTNPTYSSWAATNCASFCGMCGARRKRSASSLIEILEELEPSLKESVKKASVPQVVPNQAVPRRLSTAHEPLVDTKLPEPRKLPSEQIPNYVINDGKLYHETGLVLNPVKDGADIIPTPVKKVPSVNDLLLPKELFPDSNVTNTQMSPEKEVPRKISNKSDLPTIEEGQLVLAVPAPKVNIDQGPPSVKDIDAWSTDVAANQDEPKVEGQQAVTETNQDEPKVEGQQEVTEANQDEPKVEGQQEVTEANQELEPEGIDDKQLVQELDALKKAM